MKESFKSRKLKIALLEQIFSRQDLTLASRALQVDLPIKTSVGRRDKVHDLYAYTPSFFLLYLRRDVSRREKQNSPLTSTLKLLILSTKSNYVAQLLNEVAIIYLTRNLAISRDFYETIYTYTCKIRNYSFGLKIKRKREKEKEKKRLL